MFLIAVIIGFTSIFLALPPLHGIPLAKPYTKGFERSDLTQNPYTAVQHVHHFRDIARRLGLPEDTSTIIIDFLSRSLIQLEQIAENNHPDIFNRTFSGNAVYINGSTLNRSSQFYNFLDRLKESTNSKPVLISDNWSELKNYVNDGYSKDTVIETFEYVIHTTNVGFNKLAAQAEWVKVKQIGNQAPDIRKGSGDFVINFGESVSDFSSSFNTQNQTDVSSSKNTDSKPISNILSPLYFGSHGPAYKESFVVQKSSENSPVIYITHIYINPVQSNGSGSFGVEDFVPKDTPEVAKLKAEHLALKANLERKALSVLQQT